MDKSAIEAVYPLSPSQKGILLASVSAPDSGSFLEVTYWKIRGRLDPAALKQACSRVQARHAVLRTCFAWKSRAEPVQVVLRHAPLPFTARDLVQNGNGGNHGRLQGSNGDIQNGAFDLARAPLFRLVLSRLGEEEWSLEWSHHHIVIDGWCWPVLFSELFEIYCAIVEGREEKLSPVQPYASYLAWLRDRNSAGDEAFWKQFLKGAKPATPFLRPHVASGSTVAHGLVSSAADMAVAAALEKLCSRERVTLGALIHGLWAIVLARTAGADDVIFGTVVSGRPSELPGAESMLGLFMNTVPLRTCVSSREPFWGWLRKLHQMQLRTLAHQFNSAGQIHQWSGVPAAHALYDSVVVFENLPSNLLRFDSGRAGFTIEIDPHASRVARTPVPVMLRVTRDLEVDLIYRRDRLNSANAESLLGQYMRLLQTVAEGGEVAIDSDCETPATTSAAVPSTLAAGPQTDIEERVLGAWREVMQLDTVGMEDDFFSMGGHSLVAAQLLARVQSACGVAITLSELLASPSPRGIARLLEERRRTSEGASTAPVLIPKREDEQQPFPLTDIQRAYWVGRGSFLELGNVATHTYIEVDTENLDLERLSAAWRRLVQRHGMLRAIIQSDGTQRILAQVPEYVIETVDLRASSEEERCRFLDNLRGRMAHQVLAPDRWPLFEIRASRISDRVLRLHVSFDILIADGHSLQLLAYEIGQLYSASRDFPAIEISFRDYVLAERELRGSPAWQRARDYWHARLPTLPPAPDLPLARAAVSVTRPRFVRLTTTLDGVHWSRLKSAASRVGLTPSAVLLTAYACTLARWSQSSGLTLNVTLFNRLPLHADVNLLVGDFTSLILVAIQISPQSSFRDCAEHVQRRMWEDLDHSLMSGVEVLRDLYAERAEPSTAGMPVVFTSALDGPRQESAADGIEGRVVYGISQTPQVWLDCQVAEIGGALTVNWDAVQDLFPEGMIPAMFAAFTGLLESLSAQPEKWSDLPAVLALPEEQSAVRQAANGTEAPIPEVLLHAPAWDRARECPGQGAIVTTSVRLSYRQLHMHARQLSCILQSHGTRPGELVAIVMSKGVQQAVAAFGILDAGAAYLPIDPALPEQRVRYLLSNGNVRLVVTDSISATAFHWPEGVQVIPVDQLGVVEDTISLNAVQHPADLAYVIYTSGSTGEPKGVMIDHRSALNTIAEINRRFAVGPSDRILALSSLSFDLSVYDLFGVLAAGGTVVVPEPESARDPLRWLDWMHLEQITIWNSVPALMEMLVEAASADPRGLPSSLRLVMLSGDWIPVSLPERIRTLAPQAKIHSLGGATEASIWSIAYEIGPVDPGWKSIPYGRPLANQQFHVLNRALEVCPDYVPGELYIGGAGLARGYWRDEAHTRERFISHPQYGRLYRTGDLGRYRPDGVIEFLGRQDTQVKVQGYRVELGEIEAALLRHPNVREAIATVHPTVSGAKQIAAYIVPYAQPAPAPEALAAALAQSLPAYMIPAIFTSLDHIPVTANGKVDRGALPGPHAAIAATVKDEQIDARISQTICELLKIDAIEPDRNLFALGATSIEIIRIAARLESTLGFRIRIEDIFRKPTLRGLSALCSGPHTQMPASSNGLVADPAAWAAIKASTPGLRRNLDGLPRLAFLDSPARHSFPFEFLQRSSQRRFAPDPLSAAALGKLLSPLRRVVIDGKPRSRYASAGGLYPVQIYLHIRADSFGDVAPGIYYYHPVEHALISVTLGVELDPAIHDPLVNRPFAPHAAITFFLVMRAQAIQPIYGEHSIRFAAIEAGLISQLLDDAARVCGIGLCHIGSLDFDSIRSFFDLENGDELVHCLVGGALPTETRGERIAIRGDTDESSGIPTAVLAQRAQLDAAIVPVKGKPPSNGEIFLTGGTGFLGAWLLHELLDRTRARIHCLVRARDAADGLERLHRALASYGLWSSELESRLHAVPGDICEPGLGLSPSHFSLLAGCIGTIYHVAASVNFVYPYSALEPANVDGTREVLRLACAGAPKSFHYISSVAVFPLWMPGARRVFLENHPLEHGEALLGGYSQTKWVAESLVRIAAGRGLPVSIYRPGGVTGHSHSGVCDHNSFLSRALKSYIQLGAVPAVDFDLEMVPVDFVARSIASISLQPSQIGGTFNLVAPEPLSLSSLAGMLRRRGYPIEKIPFDAWLERLHQHHKSGRETALAPFLPLFEKGETSVSQGASSRFDAENTLRALSGTSIACPQLNDRLIGTYLDYFSHAGFFRDYDTPSPRGRES